MNIDSSSFENPEPSKLFEEIQELVHNGATSSSYKVKFYNKWHFLKRPKKEFSNNPIYIAAFEKEFELGYRLDHPNIVRYLSMGQDADGIYILTDFVDGKTLKEFVEGKRDIDIKTINKIIRQLCDGLSYLHKHQIIHGDLKPENILITNKGADVKIIDLGFSYSDCHDILLCGTPLFSAPEQFINNAEVNVRSDIFSLGKVIEFFFNGRRIPSRYRKIIDKATKKDSRLRYQNVDEISKATVTKPRQWIPVTLIVLAAFIGLFYLNRGGSVSESPSIILPDTIYRIDTIYQYVEIEVERKPTEEELFLSEFRGKLSKAHKAAFSLYYDSIPSINNQEEYNAAMNLCDISFNSARESEDSLLNIYSSRKPLLEQQLRKIAEEEMSASMSKHQTMHRQYLSRK